MSHDRISRRGLGRRQLLRMGAAGTLAGAAFLWTPFAWGRSAPWSRHAAIMDLLDGAEPEVSGISLELPSVSEDGSSISLTVSVDSPMEEDNYVESIHLFAPDNPNPEIAVFRLTPLAGRARISTRIRLNESQRVYALARMNSGEFRITHQQARVTVSGCLADDGTYETSDIMQTRVRLPGSFPAGEAAEVLTLINHPMETGFREGPDGDVLPRHIIHSFLVELDGERVLAVDLHPSMSANPYLRFHLRPGRSGTVTMTWEDDEGRTAREEAEISVG